MDKLTPSLSLVSKSPSSLSVGSKRSKSSALVEFKKPADVPKKKKKVLEEDKFVEELEKIIQRDFFPDLEKLQAQNAYHNAVENNDIHMLRELYSKYSMGATPRLFDKSNRNTPSTFETPTPSGLRMGKTPLGNEDPSATPTHLPMAPRPEEDSDAKSTTSTKSKEEGGMSLNTFFANYTSEDDHSFQEILENTQKKHEIKYAWVYGKEKEHEDKFETSAALPSIESQAKYEKPMAIGTWKYKNYNYLMYTPDGAPLTPDEQVQLAKKVPEVLYNNTRFKAVPFKEETAVKSASSTPSSGLFKKPTTKIGVDGKEIETDTPKVNGFSFVRTPSPTPGVEESPFLTWGEIEGTPFRLDGSDTPIPVENAIKPYRILETTKREKIAMQLQEKVSERYRDRKLKAIETAKNNLTTPRPQSNLDKHSMLSPAAKRLIGGNIGTIGSSRDRSLAASYTPKPMTPKVLTPSIRSGSTTPFGKFTPTPTPPRHSSGSSISKTSASSSSSSIKSSSTTSSGQKKKAADFF